MRSRRSRWRGRWPSGGHEVVGRDLGEVARGGRGRGASASRPPRNTGCSRRRRPGPDDGAGAARGGAGAAAAARGHAPACGRQRHPHPGAGAGGGGSRGSAGDADPAHLPGASSPACRSSRSGCSRRGRRSGGRCGGRGSRCWRPGCDRAARAERPARAAGPGAARALPRRDQSASWRWWRPSRSSSTRGAGRPGSR